MFRRFSGLLWRSASVRTCQNNDSGLHVYGGSHVYRRKCSVFSFRRRVTNAVIRKTRRRMLKEYKFASVSERTLSTLPAREIPITLTPRKYRLNNNRKILRESCVNAPREWYRLIEWDCGGV